MSQIVLPRFIGTREKADEILNEWDPTNEQHASVEIAARAVKLATDSFTSAFVAGLRSRGAHNVRVLGANKQLQTALVTFGEEQGLAVEIVLPQAA